MPGVRSAAVGVFVAVGSRDESAELSGASHFLEHLLFKGTPTRSALEISELLDGVGGEFNAYTAKEYTCYHARVLDTDAPLAIEVLGDMLTSSLITPADVESEREVILEEIAMHADDPEDVVHNLFYENAWQTPLGKPIAGRPESIRALSRDQINDYYREHYQAPNLVVAVAGNVTHQDVLSQVQKAFQGENFLTAEREPALARKAANSAELIIGKWQKPQAVEQLNLVLGVKGITRSDPRRYAQSVLNAVFGGGTSSRLFQEVREKRGLAYGVYSFAANYSDAGMLGISAGCLPQKALQVIEVVTEIANELAANGITEAELVRAKGQLRGGLVLGLEDSGSRMGRLGDAELFHGELTPIDQVLQRIEAVTLAEVQNLAAELFATPMALAQVGPIS